MLMSRLERIGERFRGVRQIWRRFRPKTVLEKKTIRRNKDIYLAVRESLVAIIPKHHRFWHGRADISWLDEYIEQARRDIKHGDKSIEKHLYAFILQSPRAVVAQRKMDKFKHHYRDREKRLGQLIDFNDSFVDLVLLLEQDDLGVFDENIKQLMDWFCKKTSSRCFSMKQWSAITRGLSREIALYKAVKHAGLTVQMTSRNEDAFGIDMIISDGKGSTLNVDCKTRSAYFFRLKDLVREGRLTIEQKEAALKDGFCQVIHGHGDSERLITMVRISRRELGAVINYAFENETATILLITRLIRLLGHNN